MTIVADTQVQFTDKLKADLLTAMREKKPVQLQTLGDTEDQKIGDEAEKFLKDNGYIIQRVRLSMKNSPVGKPYSITTTAGKYIVISAPSTH